MANLSLGGTTERDGKIAVKKRESVAGGDGFGDWRLEEREPRRDWIKWE